MENTYKVGDFVRYIMKNEIGLVGDVIDNNHVRCWWHMGGTKATISTELIELLSDYQVKDEVFSNEYAKKSLQARRVILLQGGDVSDLIDV
jgi:hypothetical protein